MTDQQQRLPAHHELAMPAAAEEHHPPPVGEDEYDKKYSTSSPASSEAYLADIDDESQRNLISRHAWLNRLHKVGYQLRRYNVEKTGIAPLTDAERTSTQWWEVGITWFPVNFNVLSFSAGTLAGPAFGLGMYGALFTIIGFCSICAIPPAVLTVWGPKLGMRQLVITRLMLGFLPATIFGVINMCGMLGYSILNSILGGQTLSAVADANDLTPTVGIVIMVVVALIISFCGIKIVHHVDRWSWIPVLIAFITLLAMAGTGPEGLHIPAGPDPSTARGVLGMGSVIAGFLISYSGLSSDYSLYLHPAVPRFKLFASMYLSLFLSTTLVMMTGAAFAISAQDIPAWSAALDVSNGALFDVVMGENPNVSTAARGFGKFCTAILALSTIPNLMITFYSFGLTFRESAGRASCWRIHCFFSWSADAAGSQFLPTQTHRNDLLLPARCAAALHHADRRGGDHPAAGDRRADGVLRDARVLFGGHRLRRRLVRELQPRRALRRAARRLDALRPRPLERLAPPPHGPCGRRGGAGLVRAPRADDRPALVHRPDRRARRRPRLRGHLLPWRPALHPLPAGGAGDHQEIAGQRDYRPAPRTLAGERAYSQQHTGL